MDMWEHRAMFHVVGVVDSAIKSKIMINDCISIDISN